MARIIYVEDDALMGGLVQAILSEAGHLIGVISDGGLAYETIRYKKPEMVIVDGGLPTMSGVEIIHEIRRASGIHLMPLLMLSGRSDPELETEAMLAGANGFLAKRYIADRLVDCVAAIFDQNNLRRTA